MKLCNGPDGMLDYIGIRVMYVVSLYKDSKQWYSTVKQRVEWEISPIQNHPSDDQLVEEKVGLKLG